MKLQTVVLFLVCIELCITAENEEKEAQSRILQMDKLVLQKSEPYKKTEKSFMSTLASWLLPFGNDETEDSVPEGGRHSGPQYLPPPKKNVKPSCHPCNKEPWIPVAGHRGKNMVLSFVHPSKLSGGPPSSNYGPPSSNHNGLPSSSYGPPPSTNYGPPPSSNTNYGVPPNTNYGPPPNTNYGPPPSQNYGPPNHGHTNNNFAPSPSSNYGAPPSSNYGAPPSTKYGVPQATSYQYQIQKFPPSFINLPTGPGLFRVSAPPKDYMVPPPFPKFIPSKSPGKYVPPFAPVNMYMSSGLDVPRPPPPGPPMLYGPPQPPVEYTIQHYKHNPYDNTYVPNEPIPLPNLSGLPLAPLHNHQNFHDQKTSDIEIVPSIPIADYISSIQHPVNVIQSPVVDVNVNEDSEQNHDVKLSENPIVVDDDIQSAASDKNATYQNSNGNKRDNEKDFNGNRLNSAVNVSILENLLKENGLNLNDTKFTPPPLDYTNWTPSGDIATSMLPPPVGRSPWLNIVNSNKSPKQVQIIIPYVANKLPSQEEPIWPQYVGEESNRVTQTYGGVGVEHPTTQKPNLESPLNNQFYNIRDLLKGEVDLSPISNGLPYDIISLQKNIDDWTQQEYSNKLLLGDFDKVSTTARLMPSKKIPKEYFTGGISEETTSSDESDFGDIPNGSSNSDDFETNYINSESTSVRSTTETASIKPSLPTGFQKDPQQPPKWDQTLLAISPVTKEKVYVVTPQPLKTKAKTDWSFSDDQKDDQVAFSSSSLSVRVSDGVKNNSGGSNETVKVIYSEWPHLINNLQTTTTSTPSPSRHPLFGSMDFPAYTPPPNSTVQTYSGHSKVTSVVTTQSSGPQRKNDDEANTEETTSEINTTTTIVPSA